MAVLFSAALTVEASDALPKHLEAFQSNLLPRITPLPYETTTSEPPLMPCQSGGHPTCQSRFGRSQPTAMPPS